MFFPLFKKKNGAKGADNLAMKVFVAVTRLGISKLRDETSPPKTSKPTWDGKVDGWKVGGGRFVNLI